MQEKSFCEMTLLFSCVFLDFVCMSAVISFSLAGAKTSEPSVKFCADFTQRIKSVAKFSALSSFSSINFRACERMLISFSKPFRAQFR